MASFIVEHVRLSWLVAKPRLSTINPKNIDSKLNLDYGRVSTPSQVFLGLVQNHILSVFLL